MRVETEISDRVMANRKRSKTLTLLKSKNIVLADDIRQYIDKHYFNEQITTENTVLLLKFAENLKKCASCTLYGETNGDIHLMKALPCNYKICHICNWERQKKIRRKYFKWFENNKTLCKIQKNKNIKYCTHAQLEKYLNKEFNLRTDKIEYDLMHLTLTVPHTVNGWRGSDIYIKEIIQQFHELRRLKFWTKFVYGGEYGVESTLNDSGFHTHIHALLMVKKQTKNRNLLHYKIFKQWNRMTVNVDSDRVEFTEKHIESIKVGNSLFTDSFVKRLKPQGATLIGLNCIYTTKQQQDELVKVYSKEWGSESMMRAVMETISYHFAPKMFQKYVFGDVVVKKKGKSVIEQKQFYLNDFDVEKIVKILPKIFGLTMYQKFGILATESSLSIKDNTLLEDFEETTEDVDNETGEVMQSQYFITNPLNVYAKGVNLKIALSQRADVRIQVLNAHSGREAVQQLNGYLKKKHC